MAGADILQFPHPIAQPAQPLAGAPAQRALGLAELELSNRLHRQLDLRKLLELFLEELRLTLPVEGLCYSPPDSAECFVAGRGTTRTLRSRLHLAGEYLGQIEAQVRDELHSPLAALLAPLAAPLGNALQHHRLKLMARKDPLTGLGNRMALDAALATEVARAQRFGQPFALLIADIDHFKRINDSLGHSAGDQVIRAVATQARDCLRPYDQAFRFGGEEFVVILSQTSLAKGMQIAERIRKRIAQRCSLDAATTGKITVSIGAAEIREAETVDGLFDRADRALYRAKSEGRNRSIAAD
ncbi:MAG: GGDEF domain-containing protein [Gammaproteobacteria bacterium]|nr:GGDEF domain-containing protein [Gammaproteobacteria bacterium]